MEKEALIQGLKERLGENSSVLSDRSYDEIASAALPAFADDASITDDTWKLPVSMLSSLAGQYRHDVAAGVTSGKSQWATENKAANEKAIADGIAAFKAQWEKTHAVPTPPPAPKTDEEKRKAEMAEFVKDILAENNKQLLSEEGAIGKLSKSVNTFVDEYNKRQQESLISGVRQQVATYLTSLGATSTPAVNLAVKQLSIGDKPDIDALKLEAKKGYEAIYKEFYSDGGKPFGGSGSAGGSGGADAELKKYLEDKQKIAEKEAQDAEALRKKFK